MTRRRAKRAGVVMALATALVAPMRAEAEAVRVFCLQAYAETTPSEACDPTTFRFQPRPAPDTVTPLSDPMATLNSAHRGSVVVEGNATPGSRIEVTISDGVKSILRIAMARPQADPGAGLRAGDFEVLFDPKSDLSRNEPLTVQELGIHAVREGAARSTTDPADLGHSELTVTAIAVDGPNRSEPMSVPIIKLAATPGDESAPELLDLRFPPTNWCHYAGEGMGAGGTHLGGGPEGRCSGLGPVPDVTWVACTRLTANPGGLPSGRDSYCRTNADRSFPRGQAPLSGLAVDDRSEIKTVVITITRGTQVVRTYTDAFARASSTTGAWGWSLNINDFEPSWPEQPYQISVLVEDAWGNVAEETSPPINIYPW